MATLALRSVRGALRTGDRGAGESRRVSGKGPEPPGPGNYQWRHLCAQARDPRPRFRPACLLEQDVLRFFLSSAERFRQGTAISSISACPNARTGASRAAERARAPGRLLRSRALVGGGGGDSGAFQWAGAIEGDQSAERSRLFRLRDKRRNERRVAAQLGDAGVGSRAKGRMSNRFTGQPVASHARLGEGPGGMPHPFAEAMAEWPMAREKSFFIGASGADIEAARGAGLTAHPRRRRWRLVDRLLARPA